LRRPIALQEKSGGQNAKKTAYFGLFRGRFALPLIQPLAEGWLLYGEIQRFSTHLSRACTDVD
jgi:hypothetical protein